MEIGPLLLGDGDVLLSSRSCSFVTGLSIRLLLVMRYILRRVELFAEGTDSAFSVILLKSVTVRS